MRHLTRAASHPHGSLLLPYDNGNRDPCAVPVSRRFPHLRRVVSRRPAGAAAQRPQPPPKTNLAAAAKLAPNNGRVWVALARPSGSGTMPPKADDAAAKARQLGAADPLVLSSLAIYYAESGQTSESRRSAGEIRCPRPATTPPRGTKAESLYFEAAEPLLQQQKFAEAIDILTRADGASSPKQRATGTRARRRVLRPAPLRRGRRRHSSAPSRSPPRSSAPTSSSADSSVRFPAACPKSTMQFARYRAAPTPTTRPAISLHAKALNAQSIEPETARNSCEKSIVSIAAMPRALRDGVCALERPHRYRRRLAEFTAPPTATRRTPPRTTTSPASTTAWADPKTPAANVSSTRS